MHRLRPSLLGRITFLETSETSRTNSRAIFVGPLCQPQIGPLAAAIGYNSDSPGQVEIQSYCRQFSKCNSRLVALCSAHTFFLPIDLRSHFTYTLRSGM